MVDFIVIILVSFGYLEFWLNICAAKSWEIMLLRYSPNLCGFEVIVEVF